MITETDYINMYRYSAYMLERDCSLREAAAYFDVSHETIRKCIDKLQFVDFERYLNIRDLLSKNKRLSLYRARERARYLARR